MGRHTIEVSEKFWGTATVKYDGEVKAKGDSGHFLFMVEERSDDDREVTYEVEIKGLMRRVTVKRNSVIIAVT